MTRSPSRAPARSSLVLFALGLALALSATLAHADERCGPYMKWDGRGCSIPIVGEPQGPQVFNLSQRSGHGWTALDRGPTNQRRAVVDATRRAPF